jgi:hypothetical protein
MDREFSSCQTRETGLRDWRRHWHDARARRLDTSPGAAPAATRRSGNAIQRKEQHSGGMISSSTAQFRMCLMTLSTF